MLQPNQREMSLVNHQIIYDFWKVRDATPETFEANKELRKAVRGARTKQRHNQEAKKKQKQHLIISFLQIMIKYKCIL